jgi:uncharacterized protein YjfI (DUF2170 family)
MKSLLSTDFPAAKFLWIVLRVFRGVFGITNVPSDFFLMIMGDLSVKQTLSWIVYNVCSCGVATVSCDLFKILGVIVLS